MLRCILLASMVIKHNLSKACKSWMLLCSHPRLGLPQSLFCQYILLFLLSLCTHVPSVQIFPGLKVQGTANWTASPPTMFPPQEQSRLKRWEMVDPNPLFGVHCMWNVETLQHTHQTFSPDNHQWLFIHTSFIAFQLWGLSKLFHFWIFGVACN